MKDDIVVSMTDVEKLATYGGYAIASYILTEGIAAIVKKQTGSPGGAALGGFIGGLLSTYLPVKMGRSDLMPFGALGALAALLPSKPPEL